MAWDNWPWEAGAAVALGTALFTLALAQVAPRLKLVDVPGGRKEHLAPTPTVGGLAIVATLAAGHLLMPRPLVPFAYVLGAVIVALVALADDLFNLSAAPRLLAQVAAAIFMIYGAGVVLRTVGDIIGWRPLGLWALAVPLTVFATAAVINATNMIDGVDGLAGSVGFVALAWFAYAASASGLQDQARFAFILCCAIFGFLLMNFPLPFRERPVAFLGDVGSTAIGFAITWFAIDLTQGPGRSLTPIAALWVAALPLADGLSMIIRRVRDGRSPFAADREHIHHLLLELGFSPRETTFTLALFATALGGIGVGGWQLGVPEPPMFFAAVLGFLYYHRKVSRAWARVYRRGYQG